MLSSAAICSGAAYALNRLFVSGFSTLELAKLAVAAEHNYLRVRCGLMDSYVNLFGRVNCLLKLKCKTEQHEYIPFDTEAVKIVLINTGVRHDVIKMSAALTSVDLNAVTAYIPYKSISLRSKRYPKLIRAC